MSIETKNTIEQDVKAASKQDNKPERKACKLSEALTSTHKGYAAQEIFNDERILIVPVDSDKVRTIPVSVTKDQIAVVLNSDTMEIVSKMFTSQDDIGNESKYTRTFIHSAVIAGAKQECRRLVGVWENAITKENKLHPAWSREQAEVELLQSKKMQELKAQVDVAVSLLKTEFK